MRITATVAEQLRLLHEDSENGRDLVEGLGRLSRDVALAVPSSVRAATRSFGDAAMRMVR